MRCRDVAKLSSAYLGGELDDGRASALRGHLRTCDDCRALVEDESLLVDTAARLDPIDPPASLWAAIEERLGDEEIADAGRPRWWLWWQSVRSHVALGAVAAAAAASLLWWQLGARAPSTPSAPAAAQAAESVAVGPGERHADQLERELTRADRRYQDTIRELRAIVDEERAQWPAERAEVFDAQLADLDAQIVRERTRLLGDAPPDPAERDPLYATYRAQIDLLQTAALGEGPTP